MLLRLPYEVKDLLRDWLAEHYPDRAAHVMSLIREMRGGRDNDPRFGTRMRGTGPIAELLRNRFKLACRRLNLESSARHTPDTALFRPPGHGGAQERVSRAAPPVTRVLPNFRRQLVEVRRKSAVLNVRMRVIE